MSFTALQIPPQELRLRHEKCRKLLRKLTPNAQGLLVFSRTNIYYLSGSRANGMLWLPLDGEPVLLVRKGENRCHLESSLIHMATFKSYSSIPEICAGFNSPLSDCVAAEMRALPWSLAHMLKERLKNVDFVAGDFVLDHARFEKTIYEINILRKAESLHTKALQNVLLEKKHLKKDELLHEQLSKKLRVGMTEREISHTIWHNFYALQHGGMLRMHEHGQEVFLGKISVAENALYASPFSGAMGLMGEHPAIPFMGNAGSVWKNGQLLSIDTGFIHDGYHSFQSQTFFAGKECEIPKIVNKAQECCFEILLNIKEKLNKEYSSKQAWNNALVIAKKYGFENGFMGLEEAKVPLAQSFGLAMDEGEVITPSMHKAYDLAPHAVFNVCPAIALPNLGMVSIRHSFEIGEQGDVIAFPNLEQKQNIITC